MANKRKKKNRIDYHNKLKMRENRIRSSGNIVPPLTKDYVEPLMKKHGLDNYRVELWGDIRVMSKFDSWIIETDGAVIFLKQKKKKEIRKGNDRNSYHNHAVFYDLDYCLKSIVEHDKFKGSIN